MPDFWSFVGNEKYSVGCTGQSVYLYDKAGTQLARFKDLPYAYTAAISPRGDIFVVKTTEGRLGVYSLDPPMLIKKFRFSKIDGGQDDNFCFSPDGTAFYNIERHTDSCKTALSIYDTKDFSLRRRILNEDANLCLSAIACDPNTADIFLLGYFRGENGVAFRRFVGKLTDDALTDTVDISEKEYNLFGGSICLRMKGYTRKAYKWAYVDEDLETLKRADNTLAKLWNRYQK